MNIRWTPKEVNGETYWSLEVVEVRHDELSKKEVEGSSDGVLFEEPDGTLTKNESCRAPMAFGNVNEEIKGQYGFRKSYDGQTK